MNAVYYWLQGPELAEYKPEKRPHHVFFQNRLIQKAPGRLIRHTPDSQEEYWWRNKSRGGFIEIDLLLIQIQQEY